MSVFNVYARVSKLDPLLYHSPLMTIIGYNKRNSHGISILLEVNSFPMEEYLCLQCLDISKKPQVYCM